MSDVFQPINMPRDAVTRKLGLGSLFRDGQNSQDNVKRFVGAVQSAVSAPSWSLPIIESVRVHYGGPLTDTQVNANIGTFINPLGTGINNPPPGALSVESTLAEPGKFQVGVLILAIGWHFEPVPLVFVAKGNSFVAPTTATAGFVSPDEFTNNDLATVGGGITMPLGTVQGPPVQAWLDWGQWQEQMFYYMSRGYNLQWQLGNRSFLLNDSLRFTAYVPTNGQEGAASSSEIDVWPYARLTNAYYRSALASGSIFLPAERTRIGNMTLTGNATGTTGLSVFRPTRAYETVGVTYGAMGLRNAFKGSQEFRRCNILFDKGIPIGLMCKQSNTDDAVRAQYWASASGNFGPAAAGAVIPETFSPDVNINSGAGISATGAIGNEPSLDSTVAPQPITTRWDRSGYKGGEWKITVTLKGVELTDAQVDAIKADPSLQSALASSGCSGSTSIMGS